MKALPKMKIIVKSTKTISFDGYSDDSSNSDNEQQSSKEESKSAIPID